MKTAGGYYVVVIEDVNSGKVIACASLVVEQKFIHNCSLVIFLFVLEEIKMASYIHISFIARTPRRCSG